MTDEISLAVVEQDDEAIRMLVRGPWGEVQIISTVRLEQDTIHAIGLHIDGSGAGMLGRIGLNAICRKVLEETDASQIVVEGGIRASGAHRGRKPRHFRYPNRKLAP